MSPIPEYGTARGYKGDQGVEASIRRRVFREPLGERVVVFDPEMYATYHNSAWAGDVVSNLESFPRGLRIIGGVEVPTVRDGEGKPINWVELMGLAFSMDIKGYGKNWLASIRTDSGAWGKIVEPVMLRGELGSYQAAMMLVGTRLLPVVAPSLLVSLGKVFVPEEDFWREVLTFRSGMIYLEDLDGGKWFCQAKVLSKVKLGNRTEDDIIYIDSTDGFPSEVSEGMPGYVIKYTDFAKLIFGQPAVEG